MVGVRSTLLVILILALVVAACGDDDAVSFTSQTDAGSSTTGAVSTSNAPPATSTTVAPTTAPATTAATSGSTTSPQTTAAPAAPTAADTLAGFFAAVAALDSEIGAAAELFNASYDAGAATISAGAASAIDALDAAMVVSQIPPGLSPGLDTAVLGVLTDLQSRVAALQGAERSLYGSPSEIPYVLDCLSNGADSFARFAADVDSAMALAALEPAPSEAPDSISAGVLAVRVEAIRSMDYGCDSCGGLAYTEPMQVDWQGRTVLGVEFEASFDGVAWQILIYAC